MLFYSLVVKLYGFVIRLASLRNAKARQWVSGRKDWRDFYTNKIKSLSPGKVTWIHCASYGEFEQGRPVIEALKKKNPGIKIVLTFFSPSGYEAFKDWPGADIIGYLPLDTKRNAADFLDIIKPASAIFIKYEFWLNYLFQIKKRGVKNYLVSAVFKKHHPFFKWYGGIFIKSLQTFDKLFIQDEASGKLLESIGITNYEVSGDTRFDRVLEIKENFKPIPVIEKFKQDSRLIIAGSTWPGDEKLLIDVFKKLNNPTVKLVLVPHNVDKDSINELCTLLKENNLDYLLFSNYTENVAAKILIVDAMGLLSKTYYYATVTYIGGGFDDGIHNCLEPAVYYKPVIFYGNGYEKYNEAVDLVSMGTATNVQSEEEALKAFNYYLVGTAAAEIEAKLGSYFKKKTGTTQKVLSLLEF